MSAKEIRDIQGIYPSRKETTSLNNEKISVSILRDDGVQNFAFPDTSARQPYEAELKPLFKWLNTAEKHKGSAAKERWRTTARRTLRRLCPSNSVRRGLSRLRIPAPSWQWIAKPIEVHIKTISENKFRMKVNVNLVLVPASSVSLRDELLELCGSRISATGYGKRKP